MLTIEYQLKNKQHNSNNIRTYRNPLIYAMELKAEMDREGLTQAELARKHWISKARVNQWLALLRMPKREKQGILEMGDNWERMLITERVIEEVEKV